VGTFAHNGDPCCDATNWNVKAPYATGKTSDPATFNPKLLNASQWFDSITALGANVAVLTAKHGCGFLLWPSKSKLPDGSPYGYDVGAPGALGRDVLAEFVAAADAAGVGHGFYYSIMKSFKLCHSFYGTNSCVRSVLPGQLNLSNAEYAAVVHSQVTELWTQYGNFTRLWTDSSIGGFAELMDRLQPQAAGTPKNPLGWCGTESGHPSATVGGGPVWSTGGGYHGDPNSEQYEPKFCDPQLFEQHVWFWEPHLSVRTLAELIPIYHDIVGRGMVMEIAFSIDRDGLVQDTHAAMYRALGEWVRECYGAPLGSASGRGFELTWHVPPAGATGSSGGGGGGFDRIMLREDLVLGERVRNFTLEASVAGGPWEGLANGSSIGRKRILLLPRTVPANSTVRLTIQHAIAPPIIAFAGAFAACRTS
jgi:alpha-L-fucosidase